MESRVGYLKAGWMAAYQQLGGTVPPWIRKNLGIAKGGCKVQITEGGTKYMVLIENWTPTVSRYSGRYNYAIDWEADKMEKNLRIRLAYDAKKAASLGVQ